MSTRIFTRCCRHKLLGHRHRVQLQPAANKFVELDRRGGYPSKVENPELKKLARNIRDFVPELKKFTEEQKNVWRMDSVISQRLPGDYEIAWKLDTKEKIGDWITTVDGDNNEGYSRAQFELGKNNTGIFHGYLDTRVPKDGKTYYAGYANISSPELLKSFNRPIPYDWSHYNTLMLRVRGDGRRYKVLIQMDRDYDLQWFDQYHYPLYTRGGPYWQETFIPFNKFYLSAKGRIQDKQDNLMSQLDSIKFLGITLADGHTGPFHLEIDYIGLYYDASLNEEFAYEMYENPAYKIND